MAFTLKYSQILFILLWLSLILLIFHEFYNFKPKIGKKLFVETSYSLPPRHSLISRKVLASKFDFSPFLKHHNHHHKPEMATKPPDPSENEIDPRYGVEKRRVPTGPNPLHN
ncbi:hypothetical protein L6164_026921 [Bauhinia variegata]|uniref:Uncharacterized protein n=1 Tax=Bauhinia variegata TaxID=167791 RepID=A0ACB9LRT9_BAUVA|nr:hypothetical protein L6164_026921 [Bauhinia variegata]